MDNSLLDIQKPKKKSFASLGYTKLETAELVDAMNRLLANYAVHYQKLRNFHWNVRGRDFFDIHEKFEEQYKTVSEVVDEIAERIRIFGQMPLSSLREFLETSNIKESGTDLTGLEMVKEIIKDYHILLEHLFATIEVAIENGDSGTEEMMKGFVKQVEKDHWMLTAFTHQG
ncbi:starvation-inducible DNA-binding protein [Reichenbachiella faecimaris]|uniref:Starvation-inducible DNA-binding protein n=1 Tax=Reichenbachiella faecimaris TaxID=692418 RepID=A0A1W2G8G7_REIFA|nr:DNA starvation/stationary phase protection protein [Reichenbachiella faecimaris]SMD32794.1 starvation-inducible DNA-binding protein [Reichenbachiella faecimaris]